MAAKTRLSWRPSEVVTSAFPVPDIELGSGEGSGITGATDVAGTELLGSGDASIGDTTEPLGDGIGPLWRGAGDGRSIVLVLVQAASTTPAAIPQAMASRRRRWLKIMMGLLLEDR